MDGATQPGASRLMRELYELADSSTRKFWLQDGGANSGLNPLEYAAESNNADALAFLWGVASPQQKQEWLASPGFFRVAAAVAREGLLDMVQEALALVHPEAGRSEDASSRESSTWSREDAAMADLSAQSSQRQPQGDPMEVDDEEGYSSSEEAGRPASEFSPWIGSVDRFYSIKHDSSRPTKEALMAAAGEAEKDLYRERFNDYLLRLKDSGFNYWETEHLSQVHDDHAKLLYLLHMDFEENEDGTLTEAGARALALEDPDPKLRKKLEHLNALKKKQINYYSVAAVTRYHQIQALSKKNPLGNLPPELVFTLINSPESMVDSLGAAEPKPNSAVRRKRVRAASPERGFDASSETAEQRAAKRAHP